MAKDVEHVRSLIERDNGPAGLDDAGLFGRDHRQGVAENLRMLEIDQRDHRGNRIDDIRGVPPTPEAGFDDGNVAPGASEVIERRSGDELERRDPPQLGVVDFEHAASWGDPALDLGMLSGDCLAIAIAHRCEALALAGIEALWASYDADRLPRDPGMAGRAAGWAAVGCGRRLAALGRACPAGVDRLWALAADGRQQAATAAESIAALRSIAA